MPPTTETSKQTLNQLLERAAGEKNRDKFLELLHEIGLKIAGTRDKGRPVNTVTYRPSMETDTFDIFAGRPDRHAVWRDSVLGIEQARKRMEEIRAKIPGEYFIFHESSGSVLARSGGGAPAPTSSSLIRAAEMLPFPGKIGVAS